MGSHLAEALLAAGYRVRALVRRPESPGWLSGLDVEVAKGDVRDAAALDRLRRGSRGGDPRGRQDLGEERGRVPRLERRRDGEPRGGGAPERPCGAPRPRLVPGGRRSEPRRSPRLRLRSGPSGLELRAVEAGRGERSPDVAAARLHDPAPVERLRAAGDRHPGPLRRRVPRRRPPPRGRQAAGPARLCRGRGAGGARGAPARGEAGDFLRRPPRGARLPPDRRDARGPSARGRPCSSRSRRS